MARDYLALGAAHWWLRDLTIAMGHVDTLSRTSLVREALAGARAWRSGDPSAATNRLRAAFELITEARERFYPMDGYVLDLCLLDPATPPDALADGPGAPHARSPSWPRPGPSRSSPSASPTAPASSARRSPRAGPTSSAGPIDEVDEPFLPWSSIAWQFRKGAEAYRRHLDDRNVETLARRRFGLYPQLPQVARRFGLRFALFVALDSGRFPVHPEAKRLWASPDGTTLESITRPPIAADRPVEGARLAWRIGKSMRDDVVRDPGPGPLAGPGRPLVRRLPADRRLLAGPLAMGHGQRLLPPLRPPVRGDHARPRRLRPRLSRPGRRPPRPLADRRAGPRTPGSGPGSTP